MAGCVRGFCTRLLCDEERSSGLVRPTKADISDIHFRLSKGPLTISISSLFRWEVRFVLFIAQAANSAHWPSAIAVQLLDAANPLVLQSM